VLTNFVVSVVDVSRRFALWIVLLALFAVAGAGWYVTNNFRINTDIETLIAQNLPWKELERQMEEAFPHELDRLVVVVDGINADVAEDAATLLTKVFEKRTDLFKSVVRPEKRAYFQKYGLLLINKDSLQDTLDQLMRVQPLLGGFAKDPTLRGLLAIMDLSVEGLKRGQGSYEEMAPIFALMTKGLKAAEEKDTHLRRVPWQSVMSKEQTLRDTRKFILVQPVLDYEDLSPGADVTKEIRSIAQTLELTDARGVRVRLTGSVALNDEEFASVKEGAQLSLMLSIVFVALLLVLALRSWRLIVPILSTLFAGLIISTALALMAVGALNLISIAFAVMFVGIAVDFGIQFGVRLRDARFHHADLKAALENTAQRIAVPISFAALCSALGFFAFIPTDYRGVSELGIIAGMGMLIAYVLNLTLLPALFVFFNPPVEKESIGYAWAKPVDLFIEKHRKTLLFVIIGLALGAGLLASQIRFDADPLNLKDPRTESVSTMFDIMKDPDATPYTITILEPSLEAAVALAAKIEALPEVDHVITLASFVPSPQEQAAKLAIIDDAMFVLGPTLSPRGLLMPPSYSRDYAAMSQTARNLRSLGADKVEAQKLADALDAIVVADDLDMLDYSYYTLVSGLKAYLAQLYTLLNVKAATLESISPDLRRDWIAEDGRAKIEVYPQGNARDHRVLEAFTHAVRQVAPHATGTGVSIQESGKTISSAFTRAGMLALAAIAVLSFLVLRHVLDVLRLLAPLLFAGVMTLATIVLMGMPLNFANIIALPLLLSLGVTFAIYFIFYRKQGFRYPLSSAMARAVLFSAGTTLVAFGALSLSSHTGTRGMGLLLTIALLYSTLSTFLVLPVLLKPFDSGKNTKERS